MLSKNLVTNTFYRDGVEITEQEYYAALEDIKSKSEWVNNICRGLASIEDVPEEWREEIRQRVEARLASSGAEDQEISPEEAMEIIVGGAT